MNFVIFLFLLFLAPLLILIFPFRLGFSLFIFLFSLVSALRPEIGWDYEAYKYASLDNNTYLDLVYLYLEPISAAFVFVGQFTGFQVTFFLFSLIYAVGVFRPMLILSKSRALIYYYAILILPSGVLFSYDNVRQAAALGFFMFFCWSRHHYLSYLSIGMHISSIFLLGLNKISGLFKHYFYLIILSVIYIILSFNINVVLDMVWKYGYNDDNVYGGSTIASLSFLGVLGFFATGYFRDLRSIRGEFILKYSMIFYISSIFVVPVANSFIVRLLCYLLPFVLYGILFKRDKAGKINFTIFIVIMYCFVVCFAYYYSMSADIFREIFKTNLIAF